MDTDHDEELDDLVASMGILRVGDVLATTARAIGANIITITLVTLICLLPAMAVDLVATELSMRESQRAYRAMTEAMESRGPMPEELFEEESGLAGVSRDFARYGELISRILHVLLTMFAQAAMMYCVVEFLAGRKPGAMASLRVAQSRFIPVFFTSVLFWIIVMIPVSLLAGIFLLFLFSGGAGIGTASPFGGIGLLIVPLAAAVIGVIVTCFFYVAVPATVCERLGPVDSLRRSVALTEANRLKIFFCLFIIGLLLSALSAGVSALGFLSMIEGVRDPFETGTTFYLGWAVGWVPKILQTVLFAVLGAVIYARLRGIREGIDAEALAELFA